MRKFFSIKNLKKIGGGHCGDVYKVDDKIIIKVFKNDIAYEKIEDEFNRMKKAFSLGLRTSNAYEIFDTEEGIGFTFDFLHGDTVDKKIFEKPFKFFYFLNLYAKTIRKMHKIKVSPDDFETITADFDESKASEQEKMCYELFTWIPKANHFVHGDCHKENFLLTDNEGFVIDLGDAKCGNPLYDMMAMYSILVDIPDIKFILKDKYKNKDDVNDVIRHMINIPDYLRFRFIRKFIWSIILSSYLDTNIFSKKYRKANFIISVYSKFSFLTLANKFGKDIDMNLIGSKFRKSVMLMMKAYKMGKEKLWGDFNFL